MQVPLSCPPVRANAQDIKHGTRYAYLHHRCRCAECRAHNAAVQRQQRERRARRLVELPSDAHGRMSTYTNWSCRCDECRLVARLHRQERRA